MLIIDAKDIHALREGEPFTLLRRKKKLISVSQDNAEGYISRNEMISDYLNVSFFEWKGFHGTFIELGNSMQSQRTL